MSQNNIIAGAIIFAFIVFITMKGELPAYLDLFKGGAKGAGSNQTPSTSSAVNGVADFTKMLSNVEQFGSFI